MTDIWTIASDLFRKRGQSLGHVWILDKHVLDANNKVVDFPASFTVDDQYVMVSLSEMFLKRTRVLWRESYPVVHSFITYGDAKAPQTASTVAGPGQLKDLGTANLDKVIPLAFPLAGPIVYDGQNIEVLMGLYAVPAKDGAVILINTLSQLSSIVPQLSAATQVVGVLKTGTEQLLGIDGTNLQLGLHNSFFPLTGGEGLPARPGFAVAVNKPAKDVDRSKLWVIAGRLHQGDDPILAQPVEDVDYMLIQFYSGPPRANLWATIPSLASHSAAFDTALKADKDVRKAALNLAYGEFETALDRSRELTNSDKSAVRALVAADLKKRAAALETGILFEIKSAEGSTPADPAEFSPAGIEYPDHGPLPQRDAGVALLD